MERYHFHPQLLLRTPAYSFKPAFDYTLEECLAQPYFQHALRLSGSALAALLEQENFRPDSLKPKAIVSLYNYINRMQYRSVPFGLFAGFSELSWQPDEAAPQFIVIGPGVAHLLPDFEADYRQGYPGQDLKEDERRYYANSSLYQAGEVYRYLKPSLLPGERMLDFSLSAAGYPHIIRALQKAGVRSYAAFKEIVQAHLGNEDVDADHFTEALIHAGILLPQMALLQIGYRAGLCEVPVSDLSRHNTNPDHPTSLLLKDHASWYSNLERPASGYLSTAYQQPLSDGLTALQRLVMPEQPEALRKFRKDFQSRFEGRWIPLLEAVDPELGVGYAGLASVFDKPALLEGLNLPEHQNDYKVLHWKPVHALLQTKMAEARALQSEGIVLTTSDLESLTVPEELYPSGISLLFRTLGPQVYIESAGSVTATALPARFSLFNEPLCTALQAIARNEIVHNPAVLFAEIECIQDIHIANIERRPAFYDYRIPILTQAITADTPGLLPPGDLWINVQENKVILWSQKHNKEVIPRLSTAYNYHHSPLSVYRLLCDLQHQEVRSHFHFDWTHYFPFLSFYPRLSYGSALLSLATWRFQKSDFESVYASLDSDTQARSLQALLKAKGCPSRVAWTQGDHQLVFDLRDPVSAGRLWQNITGKAQVLLQEFPFPEAPVQVVDGEQRPYMAQYIASMLHEQTVFAERASGLTALTDLHLHPRTDPGWLYLKLYLHPSVANSLLTTLLYPFLQQACANHQVSHWFFVRYGDPDFHIRLRLYCPDPGHRASLWTSLQELLLPLKERNLIQALQTDTYYQELERYHPVDIKQAESLFCLDSEGIICLMDASDGSDVADVRLAFCSTVLLIDTLLPSLNQRIALSQSIFDALFIEHKGSKETLPELAHHYRTYIQPLKEADMVLPQPAREIYARWKATASAIREGIADTGDVSRFCAHIVHMHLNRYFQDQPRAQEMVVHYFLVRYYNALLHRSK